jgi:hypothetical protein
MRYKKGQSGNPSGRPRGSKNKATAELKDRVKMIIEDNIDTLAEKLEELEPKDYVKAVIALLAFSLPKQQSVKADVTASREQIVISNLSSEGMAVIERIKEVGLDGLAGK